MLLPARETRRASDSRRDRPWAPQHRGPRTGQTNQKNNLGERDAIQQNAHCRLEERCHAKALVREKTEGGFELERQL